MVGNGAGIRRSGAPVIDAGLELSDRERPSNMRSRRCSVSWAVLAVVAGAVDRASFVRYPRIAAAGLDRRGGSRSCLLLRRARDYRQRTVRP